MRVISSMGAAAMLALGVLGAGAAGAAYSGDGESRWINVYNESGDDVYSVYYAVPGERYYSRDLLGSAVVDDGYNKDVRVDDGSGRCVFWLKAVNSSSRILSERLVNVCNEMVWSI